MPRLIVRNARIVTMDADRRELDGPTSSSRTAPSRAVGAP